MVAAQEPDPISPKDMIAIRRRGFSFNPSVLDKIGAGDFAVVIRSTARGGLSNCAIKMIEVNEHTVRHIPMEVRLMRRLSHPNVIRTFDVFLCSEPPSPPSDGAEATAAAAVPRRLLIFMEFCPGGTLRDLIDRDDRFLTEPEAARHYLQVAQAVRYIHSIGFAHGDIKLENVLLADDGRCKLTDFGLASIAYLAQTPDKRCRNASFCGTLGYMAPEIIYAYFRRDRPYCAQQADVWALGVMLYCLLHKQLPFYPDETAANERQELISVWNRQMKRIYCFADQEQTPGVMRLINAHLEPNPDLRRTMEQLLAYEAWPYRAISAARK